MTGDSTQPDTLDDTSRSGQTDRRGRRNKASDIREQILTAALKRFGQYGFGKTTMAEIAGDCGMSAGNIYRYFPNKGDVAAVGAARWLAETEAQLEAIGAEKTRLPIARLRAMLIARLRCLAELASRHNHIGELVQHVCEERRELLRGHTQNTRRLIAAVLEDGVADGSLSAADPLATAGAVQDATQMFYHYGFLTDFSLEELEQRADGVIDLLVRGLRGPGTEPDGSADPTHEVRHD